MGKRNRRTKKIKKAKDCLYCESCLPIGEGDHFCDEENVIVIEDYVPNENYCCCMKEV